MMTRMLNSWQELFGDLYIIFQVKWFDQVSDTRKLQYDTCMYFLYIYIHILRVHDIYYV